MVSSGIFGPCNDDDGVGLEFIDLTQLEAFFLSSSLY